MPMPEQFNHPGDVVDALWQGVTDRTKIIFLSHITSPTALIFPVETICKRAREAGIMTMIDGAHVPGHLPLNLDTLEADFYSGNFHKWLSAPKGSAFVYIRPEHHDWIDPLTISWGWDGDSLFERTRWQGTRDISAFLTVADAIQFQKDHDWATVSVSCHELAIETMTRLCDLLELPPLAKPEFFGQMVAVPLPDDTNLDDLKPYLYDNHSVEVPLTTQGNRKFIRVSIQAYNTRHEADTLLDALAHYFSA